MELDERNWKEFFVTDIFDKVKRGKRLTKENQETGNIPYVSSTALNNGVDNFISYGDKMRKYKNCISVANSGSVGSCFYEPFEYIASDHVTHLKNEKLNKYTYIFISCMINRWSEKYNFNREINDKRISREKIYLPVDSHGEPDYDFMTKYAKNLIDRKPVDYLKYARIKINELHYVEIPTLKQKQWDGFHINKIFKISSGTRLTKANMKDGEIPFIGSSSMNNGITNYVSNKNPSLDHNVLGVNYNGSVVENFYHPYECIFSDDVKRFHLKEVEDDKFIFLFFKTIILKQKEQFQHGYKFNENRMKRQIIMIPVNDKNEPDYEYMRQYVINNMSLKYNQYLKF